MASDDLDAVVNLISAVNAGVVQASRDAATSGLKGIVRPVEQSTGETARANLGA